ncbi:Mg2+ transporter protein, partial [Nadsonia fulvescens var. elongata DSM 6958]
NASVISGTVFDKYGNITAVSAAISKTKFLADHSLHPRDLRKIDLSPVSIVPSILVRENCILVNLLHIKAIIKNDMVMVFDTINTADASKLSLFMYDLEARLKAPGISHYGNGENWIQPYEMKALEAILINVTSTLETEIQTQLSILNHILRDLEDRVDRLKLRELLTGSKGVLAFNQKAVLIRDVMDEILESDEDLEGMRLTKMPEIKKAFSKTTLEKAKEEYDEEHFSEVEMLLDSYYKQTDEIVQQCENVISNIKSTEEIVNIILDANRNALMLLELKINVWTLGFTVGAFFAALYGMNLENYIEETDFGFGLVVGGVALFSAVVTLSNLRKLRTTTKVSMFKLEPTQTLNAPLFSRAPINGKVMTPTKNHMAEKQVPSRRDMTWKWL